LHELWFGWLRSGASSTSAAWPDRVTDATLAAHFEVGEATAALRSGAETKPPATPRRVVAMPAEGVSSVKVAAALDVTDETADGDLDAEKSRTRKTGAG
jgi:hypothetical protein